MCGISGIFSDGGVEYGTIQAMVGALAHRGPDAVGTYISPNGNVALGHNRLSVLDLSAAANQPMTIDDGRYTIVYNGEIYNFQEIRLKLETLRPDFIFTTSSDTEVILYAFRYWGEGMLQHLRGMFALAIWDQAEQALFVCRDSVGKKPLFYYRDAENFIFSSEIKALLKHPIVAQQRQFNKKAISHFLHLGYIPEPDTLFTSIYKFPAGSWAVLRKNEKLEPKRFWNITDDFSETTQKDPLQAIGEFDRILTTAVEKRLIGDVPLGVFLSGGTDSSLVAAMASKKLGSSLKTFSIGFKESKFDERKYAASVAKHLKADHHEFLLSESEAVSMVDTYIHHFDEPFADTSAIPTMLVSKIARESVTVALTGDGGDELFQGYGSYVWADRLARIPWKLAKPVSHTVMAKLGSSRIKRVSGLFAEVEGSIQSHIFSQEQYFFSQHEIHHQLLLNPDEFHLFEYSESIIDRLTPAEEQALFDFNYYLKDDLLVKVDRASMYYGLECRCPFLDRDLIEFSVSLDESLKRRNGVSKWLPKKVLEKYLPHDLVYRTKWGFGIPLSTWLKQDLKYLMDSFLSDTCVQKMGLFKVEYVRELRNKFLGGSDYLFNRLWVIIIMHKWMRENLGSAIK
jgi:asparagine synthase (glutamine-hydrolysing)